MAPLQVKTNKDKVEEEMLEEESSLEIILFDDLKMVDKKDRLKVSNNMRRKGGKTTLGLVRVRGLVHSIYG